MSIEKIQKGDELSQSKDLINDNINKLKELFPEIIAEDKIDFKVLRDVLGDEIEEEEEYYRFTWAGKSTARREAHKVSTGTLRPVKEESVDWDKTQNLYFEGDNLEVLKVLQKSYNGKIGMIYIDPPYNTGNDFVYRDNYKDNLANYLSLTGQRDGNKNILFTNSESDGRYHSNWLNMMMPRLKLAKSLLTDDGIIFISIGQKELSSLNLLCNDIFGEVNKISIVGRLAKSGGNKGKFFSPNLEYILVYAKNIRHAKGFRDEMDAELVKKVYTKTQKGGVRDGERYRAMGLYQSSLDSRANQRYYIEAPDGSLVIPPGAELPLEKIEGAKITPKNSDDGCWRWTFSTYIDEKNKGNVEFNETNNKVLVDSDGNPSKWNVNTKIWLNNRMEEGQQPNDFISKYENRHSAKELSKLDIPFDFPKPINLIKYLIKISRIADNEIILDFFSGSGTTAHAVMLANLEDGQNRRYIQIQLPEETDSNSEAFKKGFKTISEIGRERIKRAGQKIKEENPLMSENYDFGYKLFKLDTSNIRSWDGNPENLGQRLYDAVNNIKEGRTEEDVLYEILLKYGLDLSLPIEERVIEGIKVFSVGLGALFICLGDNIISKVSEGIGMWKEELNPEVCRVIFKDTGFTDVEKTNSTQTLKRFGIEEIKSI